MRIKACFFLAILIVGMSSFSEKAWAIDEEYLVEELPEVATISSSEIQAKAAELGHDPVRIYEFVRNEFEFQNYAGLMKGPEVTLLSGGGNDYDLAALLVSLLRASGTPARFVRGRIVVTDAQAMAWVGTTTGVAAQLYFRRADQAPSAYQAIRYSNGTIGKTQIWVEAKVDMARYRGAADSAGSARKVWVPLDPSFKLSDWTEDPGLNYVSDPTLAFDYDDYFKTVKTKRPLEIFESVIQRHLASANSGSDAVRSVEDVLLVGKIRKEYSGVLPNALPYFLEPPSATFPQLRSASLQDLHVPPYSTYQFTVPDPTPSEPNRTKTVTFENVGRRDYLHRVSVHLCYSGVALNDCANLALNDNRKIGAIDGYTAAWGGKRLLLTFPPSSAYQESVLPNTGYATCVANSQSISARPLLTVDGVPAEPTGDEPTMYGSSMRTAQVCSNIAMSFVVKYPRYLLHDGYDRKFSRDNAVGGTYVVSFDTWGASPALTRRAYETALDAQKDYPIEFDANNAGLAYVDNNPADFHNGVKDSNEKYFAVDFEAQEALTGSLLNLAKSWWCEQVNADTIRGLKLFQRLPFFFSDVGYYESRTRN